MRLIIYKHVGFSLIELLIVLAIISILAVVAFGSYNRYVMETKRGDARTALTRAATLQERWFFQNSSYTDLVANVGGAVSPDGYYDIAVAGNCANNQCTTFTITATPSAGKSQVNDTDCATITITNTMVRGSTPGTDCW